MRSASVSLSCAQLMALVLMALLSLLLVRLSDASPVPSPSDNAGTGSSGDLLIHHITRSRYCGRKLTETLAMLCQGRYPMMGHHRSVRHNVVFPEYLSDQPQQPVEVEVATLPDSGFPYSRSSAHRRVRRAGIYDECCKKSCSYTELKSYCE